jgi:hypothetical protein
MKPQTLDRANEIFDRMAHLGKWLEGAAADLTYGPRAFPGTILLSPACQAQIKALAKEDVERQLSQLRQEFEAL